MPLWKKFFFIFGKSLKMDREEASFFLSTIFVIFLITSLMLGFRWFYSILSFPEDFISSYRIIAFLKEGLSEEEINAVIEKVKRVKGVRKVDRLKKEDLLEVLPESLRAEKRILKFLPEVVDVYLDTGWVLDITKIKSVMDELMDFSEIEHLDSATETMEKILSYRKFVREGGRIFIIMLGIGGFLIIYHFIYLTLHSIRRRLEIMKLVGAGGGFIKIPIIIRGIISGLSGAILSLVLMKFVFHSEISSEEFIYLLTYTFLAGGGGSYFALRRYGL